MVSSHEGSQWDVGDDTCLTLDYGVWTLEQLFGSSVLGTASGQIHRREAASHHLPNIRCR